MSRLHGGYQQSGKIRAEASSPKMALIYSYIHEHTCTYKTPQWIYKNPKDAHGLVFISTWTEKTLMLPRLVHGCWKTSAFFCNFLKYFQPSFPMHPGNYGNTDDLWSCWEEQWHGYAQASKQKSISSIHWKFRFCPSLWRADVNYESHDYSAIFFLVMLIDLDKVSFFTYKICCIYNK